MIKDDFKDNAKDIGGDKDMLPARGPVSKIEKNRLEQQRGKPEQARHYTIDGTVEQHVHERINQERESRIKHIEKRLSAARDRKGMKRQFNRGRD